MSGQAKIEGGEIVIRVSIDALPFIADHVFALEGSLYAVTDAPTFARDLVYELNREEEDGTTPIHRMFDAAISEANEQGADGVTETHRSASTSTDGGTPGPDSEAPRG